jgi:GH43 family beta-xylosidase
MKSSPEPSYRNPITRFSCPDPYVLKHRGEYWAYCTGFWNDGRCFGVLYSPDLIHWTNLGGAMAPLPGGHPCYWAPETYYDNGLFTLYYSVGNEVNMEIRAAVSDHPAGPFVDSGRRLTQEQFAIDAHVYTDQNGSRYLFYATDYLEHTHIGTGTAMDRLLDPLTPAGRPRPVTRALYDWQVYDPQRKEKGGVRWHTVEGPFVLKHKGKYYQMFSGGNWQNPTYGVSYATSETVEAPGEWEQAADGESGLPILRSAPERGVIGPGHNSVVRGPANRQLYCVYHRWLEKAAPIPNPSSDPAQNEARTETAMQESERLPQDPAAAQVEATDQSARVMAIDRLEWVGERMVVFGPTVTPQPIPIPPTLSYFKEQEPSQAFPGPWKITGGRWKLSGGMAVQEDTRPGEISEACLPLPAPSFYLEVGVQSLTPEQRNPGAYGVFLLDGEGNETLAVELIPRARLGTASGQVTAGQAELRREWPLRLPLDFASHALHTVRLEVDGQNACLAIDELQRWQGRLPALTQAAGLFTRNMAAGFSAFEWTAGWEDQFLGQGKEPAGLGWQVAGGDGTWSIRDAQLWQSDLACRHGLLAKGPPMEAYEVVVNACLVEAMQGAGTGPGEAGGYGFSPALGDSDSSGPLIILQPLAAPGALRWALAAHLPPGSQSFPLPEGFDPAIYQQFRFTRRDGRLSIQWEGEILGEIDVPPGPSRPGLYAHQAIVAFDMVRVTAIP